MRQREEKSVWANFRQVTAGASDLITDTVGIGQELAEAGLHSAGIIKLQQRSKRRIKALHVAGFEAEKIQDLLEQYPGLDVAAVLEDM